MSDQRNVLDEMLEELERTRTEKTLDEALDEMDQWSEQMVENIKDLSPEEFVEYFRQVRVQWEEMTGEPLKIARRDRHPPVSD
jgi:hypothetical protein